MPQQQGVSLRQSESVRAPVAVGVSWGQDASVIANGRRRTWALSDPRLSSPARMRKKCCYGQKNFGSICSSLSRLQLTSHTTNIRIKCERLYFYKEVCSFIHWSSSLLLTMFPHIYIYIYIYIYMCVCVCVYVCVCMYTCRCIVWVYNTWKLRGFITFLRRFVWKWT